MAGGEGSWVRHSVYDGPAGRRICVGGTAGEKGQAGVYEIWQAHQSWLNAHLAARQVL